MRKSKFTRAQIVQAIRQVEADTVVGKVCRKLGVTEATFYPWKKTYAVLDLHELRERRQLRDENLRLKQCVFRPMSITCFGGCRSPVSVDVDHPFRSMSITRFGRCRSPDLS